ncbi:MAG: hypothetical protein IJ794_16450 [Lachnospiraceae bacterium]|nr:hypothetical protein [Lachnospiraceae bacterium]
MAFREMTNEEKMIYLQAAKWDPREQRDAIRDEVCRYRDSVPDAKGWIDLIDGVQWENYAQCHTVELMENLQGMMDILLDEGDRELLQLCLMKDLFPGELFDAFSRKAADRAPECLSMFVLKKHMGNFCPI